MKDSSWKERIRWQEESSRVQGMEEKGEELGMGIETGNDVVYDSMKVREASSSVGKATSYPADASHGSLLVLPPFCDSFAN